MYDKLYRISGLDANNGLTLSLKSVEYPKLTIFKQSRTYPEEDDFK